MGLKEQLKSDMVAAMRSGDQERRDALRLVLAAVQHEELEKRTSLDDDGVLVVLNKQAKMRRESIADYEKAGRPEMATSEQAELAIIETYLPQMMSRDEVKSAAMQVISELGVTDTKGMGQVMGKLMPQLRDKADGRLVNEVVRELLQTR